MISIFLGILTALLVCLFVLAFLDISKERRTKEKKKEEKKSYNNEYRWNNNQKKFEKILNLVIKDFNNSPYSHKYKAITINNSVQFTYNFNNGYKLNLVDEYLFLSKQNGEMINSFNLDSIKVIELYRLINKIIDRTESQRTYSNSDYERAKRKYDEYQKESDNSRTKSEPKVESTGNQKLDKILEKIKLREEQLRKMKSNDSERSALENELKTYKNIANKMKYKI